MSNKIFLKKVILAVGDIIVLYLSLVITLYFSFWGTFNMDVLKVHIVPFSIIYFFWLLIFYISGLYDLHLVKTRISFYARTATALGINLVLGMMFFYTVPMFGITPKTNLLLNILVFGLLFLGWRKAFYSIFSIHFSSRTVIVGGGPKVERLKKEISDRPYLGHKIIPMDLHKDLLSQIQEKEIDTVIFTEELESDPRLLKALYVCLPTKVNFMDFASAYEFVTEKIPVSHVSASWFLENLKEGEKVFYDKIKRIIDVIAGSLILIISSPLWPFIALGIKSEDSGPVFYSQTRVGKNKQNFTLHKFRSMKVNAENDKAVWAKKDDPRITWIGHWLRKSHLDELPQMINIIKGDISLIGPRPERPEFVQKLEQEVPYYHLRHIIKPGFTGWAQIKFRYGRSVMDSKEKLEYDLYYIKNRNLLLDLGILLKTFRLFFRTN